MEQEENLPPAFIEIFK